MIYFFKYDFGGDTWYNGYTLFNMFGGAVQILSMMIFYPLLRKWISSLHVFYVSFAMAITGYAVLFVFMCIGLTDIVALFLPAFLVFAAFGMLTVLTTVFLANTVDYGELKNNRRDESVIFSMQTFVVKLASGVAAMIASVCLSVCNLSDDTSGTAAVQAAGSSILGLRMTMTVLPIAGLMLAVFLFHRKYILTEQKVEEIAEQIRNSQK